MSKLTHCFFVFRFELCSCVSFFVKPNTNKHVTSPSSTHVVVVAVCVVCFVRQLQRFNTEICKFKLFGFLGREENKSCRFFTFLPFVVLFSVLCVYICFVSEEKVARNNRVLMLLHTS